MKKLQVLLILISFLLSSCLTTRKIERNCDKFAQICTVDKRVEIRYRDTTIYVEKIIEVPVPGYDEVLYIRDSINIVTVFDTITKTHIQYAELDTITKSVGLISTKVWVTKSKLGIDAWLNDSTFLFDYKDSIKIYNAIKDKETTNTIKIRFIPKFYKFLLWLFVVQVLFSIVWLLFKFNVFNRIQGNIKR